MSTPPSSGRTLVIPLARTSSVTRALSLRWVTNISCVKRLPSPFLKRDLSYLCQPDGL